MSEQKLEKVEDLSTLQEFAKKMQPHFNQMYVHNRWGKLIGRYTIEASLKQIGHYKVFNYFENKDDIMDVYIAEVTDGN